MSEKVEKFELSKVGELNAVAIFTGDYLDQQTAFARELLKSFTPDLSTQKGRDAIKTFSRQYATVKVRVDDAGKSLGSDLRDELATINAKRNSFKDDWQDMQDEARKPLTDYEAVEAAKEAEEKQKVLDELDRIERERVEAIEKREAELAEKEAAMELAEEQRLAKEAFAKSEQDRLEREATIAAEATVKAERDAAEAVERAEREKQEAIDNAESNRLQAIQDAKDAEIEAARVAERVRIEAEQDAERKVQAERDRIAAEKLAEQKASDLREADKKHMGYVNSAAVSAMCEMGLCDASKGKDIITAIAKGLIPHVKISY